MKLPAYLKTLPLAEIGLSFAALLFLFPGPYHTIPELDASWQAVLEVAFFNQWQFGKDIIFTGGPLSFLYAPTSIGYFPKTQVVVEAAVLFVAILSVFMAIRKQPIWVHILVFVCLFCGANSSRDAIYLISIPAICFWMLQPGMTLRKAVAPVVFIGILGLMKFTAAVLGFSGLLVIAGLKLWEKKSKEGLMLLLVYLGSVGLIWVVIGQSLFNLPAFVKYSWILSQGYAAEMHLQEPEHFLKYLVVILLLSSVPVLIWAMINRSKPTSWAVLILSALSIYVFWKTGITRFGTHITFFLQGAVLMPFLLLPFFEKKKIAYLWTGITFLVFLWAYFSLLPTNKEQLKPRALAQAQFGLSFITTAGGAVDKFADLVPYVKSSHTLHRIKELVGQSSIDVLYYHQGILLLNELNYVPRPTIQNYAAYNKDLAEWNLEHMQKNPPEFILCRNGLIDSRYPTVDDNLFFREVLENYLPVLKEEDYMLLKRTESPRPFNETSVLFSQVGSGQTVDVSAFSDFPLWVKVKYKPSPAHRAAAFLFKPEVIILHITTVDGTGADYRLIGGNLEGGFLLSPKLETITEIETFLNTGQAPVRIKDFILHAVPGNSWFPTKQFDIEVVQLQRN